MKIIYYKIPAPPYLIPADVVGWRPALSEVEGLPHQILNPKIEIQIIKLTNQQSK